MNLSIFSTFFYFLVMMTTTTFFTTINLIMNNSSLILSYPLFSLSYFSFSISLIYDWMTTIFITTVLIISSAVTLYSKSYMETTKYPHRFAFILLVFIFSMMMLLMSNNFITLLLGWDGLGLSSYALVIFYQNNPSSASAMITALSNRMGDTLILISLALMLSSLNYNLTFDHSPHFIFLIVPLIIFAAFTKSAQIPFSAWLPEAMAAPTPISSLVHSSTLVAAGVFLLIRFFPIILMNTNPMIFIWLSISTMIMAAVSANFQFDLKKIIALSTLSQLALMMTILFLGHPQLAFFHLITHAMFKALLFLTAGIIIHNNFNCQDIRLLGSLTMTNPITTMCFILANFCLCGAPFMSGFYSKDLIIESYTHSSYNYLIQSSLLLGMFLTCMYTFRLFMYLTRNPSFKAPFSNSNDLTSNLITPTLFMSFLALLMGSLMGWLIFPSPPMYMLTVPNKITPLILLLLAIFLTILQDKMTSPKNSSLMYHHSIQMWFIPHFSTISPINTALNSALKLTKSLDTGWGEFIGPQNTWSYIMKINSSVITAQYNLTKTFLIPGTFWAIMTIFLLFSF